MFDGNTSNSPADISLPTTVMIICYERIIISYIWTCFEVWNEHQNKPCVSIILTNDFAFFPAVVSSSHTFLLKRRSFVLRIACFVEASHVAFSVTIYMIRAWLWLCVAVYRPIWPIFFMVTSLPLGNHTVASGPVKQSWGIWVNLSSRSRPHFYQTRSAWSVDQGSNKNHSPAYNFAPTVTKFCVMWEGLSLPHDTKFGKCRCKIVDSRSFLSWSLIHGLRWSGLIKVGPVRIDIITTR